MSGLYSNVLSCLEAQLSHLRLPTRRSVLSPRLDLSIPSLLSWLCAQPGWIWVEAPV